MKALGKILIILIAALVIVGVAYPILQTSLGSAGSGQPIGGDESNGQFVPPDQSTSSSGFSDQITNRGMGHGEGRGGSWETVGRNLLEMAVIVATMQLLWSIGRWLKRTGVSLARKNRLNPSRS